MGITDRNGTRSDGKNHRPGGDLSSFAEFCISALLKREVSKECFECNSNGKINYHDRCRQQQSRVAAAIDNAANSYINGEAMEAPIEALFEILTNDKDADAMDSDQPISKSYPYQSTDLEIFRMDLLRCLENTLLHEYLSSGWDHIDEFIAVNQRRNKTSVGDACNQDKGKLSGLINWYNIREAYLYNKLLDDLKNVHSFATMTNIFRSVYDDNKSDSSKPQKLLANNSSEEDAERHRNDGENHRRQNRQSLNRKRRRPTVYFLGGGMGAGKSTVISYLKETGDEMFRNNPVIIEADAFKHSDPFFHVVNASREKNQKLLLCGDDSNSNSCLELACGNSCRKRVLQSIHEHSTDAANQQLVGALANQRDVVVDGTMSWMPYVKQTIAMVRDAHKHRYKLGPGYSKVREIYWEQAGCIDTNGSDDDGDGLSTLPYRVEMVGVTIDPEHAVARGIRRAIVTGRGVPVNGQIRSHRLYSQHFPIYAGEHKSDSNDNSNDEADESGCLFDRIRLYDTGVICDNGDNHRNKTINWEYGGSFREGNTAPAITNVGTSIKGDTSKSNTTSENNHSPGGPKRHRKPPKCIAWKESPDKPLSVVTETYERFLRHKSINDDATSVTELYPITTATSTSLDGRASKIPPRLREAFAMAIIQHG